MDGSKSHSKKHKHKHKHKHKRKYSAFESDSSGDDHPRLSSKQMKYEKELQRIKEEQKQSSESFKSIESAEAKRMRRLAKKEAKEKKKSALRGVDDLGYTNTNNPFGDARLTETFTWNKKLEMEGVKNVNSYEQKKRQKEKQDEMRVELEKVKKIRQDREIQKMARDEEMELLQRQKEAAMFSAWETQEDDFHLHQARLRTSIRIRDGRAKPIDLLAAYINPVEENLEIQMHEPYSALIGLSIDDLEDLIEDIKVYITIDQKNNVEFWEDITLVVEDELSKLRKKKKEGDISSSREVINSAVQTDVMNIFKGKTYSQLVALQGQITSKIKAGGSIDIGYWETLLQQLKAFMAKARLKERHQKFLKTKLNELKMESTVDDETNLPSEKRYERSVVDNSFENPKVMIDEQAVSDTEVDDSNVTQSTEGSSKDIQIEDKDTNLEQSIEEEDIDDTENAYAEYEAGCYSPKLVDFNDVEEDKWTDVGEDGNKLYYLREQVRKGSTVEEEEEADNLFNTEMLRGMNENEEAFNVPAPVTAKKYLWSDKYRPRKPRFFNRVHTGYEWNKYNQTHYDTDNPPPKIVQGYKFNIFYPDLIDKNVAPEYTLTPIEEEPDFATLRFCAGPPYEDIAFKVVNREWEYSHRHGFRCQFYNNIFQLYFHFKRYRYRR